MIRVAVVDDDLFCRQAICQHLDHYARNHETDFEVLEYTDGDELLENYPADFDILFLDVMMQYTDGLQTALQIRKVDPEVLIFFITNMPQYASSGYAVEAMDYLLKPVPYPEFEKRIDRAIRRLQNNTLRYLTVTTRTGPQKINVRELSYVEVRDHDLMFHTLSGVLEAKGTLSEVEKQLDPELFFRSNKCYLVNLDQVQSVRGCDVSINGEILQVSRARKKDLMDALNQFLNR